ncbi:MAG: hypothetical protein IJI43_02715 [Bacilli bacterium]|nr:hypothetical protein [Bacilli bacterium]
MTITEAKRKIELRLKELNYGTVTESLYINKFGNTKISNNTEVLDDTVTSILDGTEPSIVIKKYNYTYNQLSNAILEYMRMLNEEHEIKDTMLSNYLKEESINKEVDSGEFILNYLHTLQDKEVDHYYLYSPTKAFDNNLYHSKNLFELLSNHVNELERDINNNPEEVFNKFKNVYNKMDANDKPIVANLPIMNRLRKVLPSNKINTLTKSKVKTKK